MIPIGDENVGRRAAPIVNYALIAANTIVFLFELTLSPSAAEAFFATFGAQPAGIVHGQHLWSVLTSLFVHSGWAHLIGNMVFLYVFGDNVEDAMGHLRYLIFYLLCGIAAAAAQIAVSSASTIPLVGASGAISGVLGAYILLFPQGRVRSLIFLGIFFTVIMIPAWVQLGLWFLLQLVLGVVSFSGSQQNGGVAFFAHVGGFLVGMALVWLFVDRAEVERQRQARQALRSLAAASDHPRRRRPL
ncbi:MAG: rhomboid family intramembrane serine protease [Thermomicrobiales bacterium]|nr:rhomboid family intramembrane serine protease [Thermomicrobiales bacterium]